jgi:hypothetical protein
MARLSRRANRAGPCGVAERGGHRGGRAELEEILCSALKAIVGPADEAARGGVLAVAELVASRVLAVGTDVEVRNRFCAAWSRGFEVAEATGDGYRLRRQSDRYVLPAEFRANEVRRVS